MKAKKSIAIVDDARAQLAELETKLATILVGEDVQVRSWAPKSGDDAEAELAKLVNGGTGLVVTDYDLTGNGSMGLFGATVVAWCQARLIPVADFSRNNAGQLPSEPMLFELRVPSDLNEGAHYAARLYLGFRDLADALGRTDTGAFRSPAEALATVLERPKLENRLSLYTSLLGAASPSLLERMKGAFAADPVAVAAEKNRLLSYVLGHLLVNAVLRYPGPILSDKALCAYAAVNYAEREELSQFFAKAVYAGPFAADHGFYWRSEVDDVLEALEVDEAPNVENPGALRRSIVETALGRRLARHECARCLGENGGYLCPFTHKTVCERRDCSVGSTSWIPSGADVSRVDRDFYDEWAPFLGI